MRVGCNAILKFMIYDLAPFGLEGPAAFVFFIGIVLWALFWKGLALWHSARRGSQWWFVILLLVNMIGALELFYLFFVAKLKPKDLFSFKK